MEVVEKNGLLQFISFSLDKLNILIIESADYLPNLRKLMPNAEIYSIVNNECISKKKEYENLNIHWYFIDYISEKIPFKKRFFDYIIADYCLEKANNTQELVSDMSYYLKATGCFLSSFTNAVHWEIIQRMMEGSFPSMTRRLFTKKDYYKLLKSSFFDDIKFSPIYNYNDKGNYNLIKAGFADELELNVSVWLVKSYRFNYNIRALKTVFSEEVRTLLGNYIHRIEYGISPCENAERLMELCKKRHILKSYLIDYILVSVLDKRNFLFNIGKSLNKISDKSLAKEWLHLITEKIDNVNVEEVIDCVLKNDETNNIDNDAVRRVKDCKNYPKMNSPEKTIAFISCVSDESWYTEAKIYLDNLIVPNGFSVEFIVIRDAESMCEGYNRAMKQTKAKYKVYFHQDCYVINENMLLEMLNIFKDEKVGIIGTIGAKRLPENVVWWNDSELYGRIIHMYENEIQVDSIVDIPQNEYEEVAVVDGLFMATQYDLTWREDLFTGWHFYDVSQCTEFLLKNYKVVVPRQNRHWCIHCASLKPIDKSYEKFKKIFIKEYMIK